MLLDCWRTGGANNSEVFITGVAATLARYPDEIIYEVTDPRSGLPAQLSWMPTIKDVKDACDKAYAPILERERSQRIIAEQLADRKLDEDRSRRPTREEMLAKYGENWGLTSLSEKPKASEFKAPTIEQLSHHYKHYDLQFKPKNHAELEDHIERGFSPGTI